MELPTTATLRIGAWCVNPISGQMSRAGETVRVEARTMRLLVCLAENAGEVVSVDDLLSQVWPGVIVTSDSVYQAVTSLRRLLGDDPKQPSYIATVPRLGYRMIATVTACPDSCADEPAPPPPAPAATRAATPVSGVETSGLPPDSRSNAGARPLARQRMMRILLAAGALLFVACLVFYLFGRHHSSPQPKDVSANAVRNPRSIAVLPFLDLTDRMNEEPFADGMTEELIDKLSKSPGLRVSPPTSSFYFKGKQLTVADIARSLGVAYVLDGSVRKSGPMLRVAARLVRADDGFIVWSETYDRPWKDKLMVQDDIASEVTKALQSSIR
jgi:transcriptional activator of cad operon